MLDLCYIYDQLQPLRSVIASQSSEYYLVQWVSLWCLTNPELPHIGAEKEDPETETRVEAEARVIHGGDQPAGLARGLQ